MGLFQNDFFSIAGQKERLANVGATLLAATGIKKGGVKSNTGVKVLDTALSAVASRPFTTAGIVAGVANPAGAVSALKSVGKAAASEFSKATLGQKAVAVVAAPVVASALASSSKLRSGVVNAPSSLASFGGNIGSLVENPSIENLTRIAKENPLLTGAAAATGLVAVGAAGRGVAQVAATALNTSALRESTKQASGSVLTNQPNLYPSSVAGESSLVAPVTDSSVKTPIVGGNRATLSRPKRRRKPRESPRISQSVRVNITDDRDISDRKVFKQRRR